MTPVAIIDIGSNSVRLVVYEGLSRSPTPLFNEKILCGLGRNLGQTGRLHEEGVERALATLRRFRVLAAQAGAQEIHTLATAAAREAENGPAFVAAARKILGHPIRVLTGPEEAHFAALGIVCGFDDPKGISADMGGGSVEFVPVDGQPVGEGITLPLGGLRLQENSGEDPAEARRIAREALKSATMLKEAKGGTFYAVGGTWRAIGRLHMARSDYPLHVMHNYEIGTDEARKLCRRLLSGDLAKMRGVDQISSNRRALLPYGAALLAEIMSVMKPERIVFSALGVREGYLYSLLPPAVCAADPLLSAAEEMAVLRSRSPKHARELARWTKGAFKAFGIDESRDEARYRKAACLLADVTWRSHPDYRGSQAYNIISNATFVGVSHPGRVYVALSSYFRHEGLGDDRQVELAHRIAGDRIIFRSRVTGALMRVGYLLSAAMSGILSEIAFEKIEDGVALVVPKDLADFEGERLHRRIQGLMQVTDQNVTWTVR